MSIVKALFLKSRYLMALAIVAGCASAVTSIGLIHLLNSYLSGSLETGGFSPLLLFLILLALSGFTAYWAHVVISRLGLNITFNMTELLIRRVLSTDFRKLETLGKSRLYAAVSGDIASVNSAATVLPNTIIGSGCLIAGAAYMAYLAWQFIAVMVALAVAIGTISYFSSRTLNTLFFTLRNNMDELHGSYRGVFEGTKELKLDRPFSSHFVSAALIPACKKAREIGLAISKKYAFHYNWSLAIFFLVIAYITFLPQSVSGIDRTAATGIVITLLYIQGPLNDLFQVLPVIVKGNVALRRVSAITDEALGDEEDFRFANAAVHPFETIEYKNLSYVFTRPEAASGEAPFTLGPVSLSLARGQIIFITGGNGAGKSTLGKLLCGLYAPATGSISINGKALDVGEERALRCYFSAIFSDFHLFREMADMFQDQSGQARLNDKLAQLGLDDKVNLARGDIPTHELSQGQKKRLALSFALASDRPVFLFDEWAADQDPEFRHYFYSSILPELKQRGKCVLVISHDDRYFHCADSLYRLEYGALTAVDGAGPDNHPDKTGASRSTAGPEKPEYNTPPNGTRGREQHLVG